MVDQTPACGWARARRQVGSTRRLAAACAAASTLALLAQAAPTLADQPGSPTAPQTTAPNTQPPQTPVPEPQAQEVQEDEDKAAALPFGDTFAPYRQVGHFLQQLNRDGVHLRAQLIEEPAASVTGGYQRGSTISGQLQFGGDFDLGKLIGDPNATFHMTVYQNMGRSLSARDIGLNYSIQGIYKNKYEHLHFGVFAYEQNFLHNNLNIVLGRLGTTSYFANVPEFCDFINGAGCGISTILKQQSGLVLPPSSTWGGRTLYRITPHMYVNVGLNEVNPYASASDGLRWSTASSTGVAVPMEIGFVKTAKETRYPFSLKIGEIYSDVKHSDPFYNTKGQSIALFGGTAHTSETRNVAYISGDKTVWRSGRSSVILFGNVTHELEYNEVFSAQYIAGAVLTGPFRSRPLDRVGFEAFDLQLTQKEADFLRDSRIKAGGIRTDTPRSEHYFEWNYSFALFPGARVAPSVSYIVNPDDTQFPRIKFIPKNAVVLGVQLTLNFGTMLGVPGFVAE